MARRRRSTAYSLVLNEWSSPLLFVFAASGAAIGLKNVWQFPFLLRQYGGSAFLVVYVLCLFLIALPLLIAEVMLGRGGRQSPVNSMRALAERMRRRPLWGSIGWIGMCAGLLILSYLSVIAGWIMAYTVRMAAGALAGLTADGLKSVFAAFVSDPEKQLLWHSLFIGLTMAALVRGVRDSLEPVVRYAVPALLVLLGCSLIYAVAVGDLAKASSELLHPDFTRLTQFGILAALAHAFFSLGLGTGGMLIYGAYLPSGTSIPRLACVVAGIDTLAGIVAGLAVLSVLLAGGLTPVSRSELVFQALPLAYDQLPWGRFMGTLFFVTLALAAWLSAIALMEPWIAWFEETWAISRPIATLICGAGAWLLGIVSVLSFSYWSFTFRFFDALKTLGAFDVLQILTSGVLLPASGILIALYAGWLLKPDWLHRTLEIRSPCAHEVWLWSVRLITPALILVVSLYADRLFL
jgi:NSS family neurotransmitter:Na+ symporter